MGDDDGLADGRESSLLSSVESAAARARLRRLRRSAHAIDLETGAIVGVTVQGADQGDTTTMQQTLPEAAAQLEAILPWHRDIEEHNVGLILLRRCQASITIHGCIDLKAFVSQAASQECSDLRIVVH